MKTADKQKAATRMKRRRFLKYAIAGAAALALPLDAIAVEPRWIQVTRHDVHLHALASDLDGLTVAQLSDLHRCSFVPDSLIESAVEVTTRLAPDLVVLTGDFVSSNAENAGPCADMLSHLKPPLGLYAVLGNHDHWTGADLVRRHLERRGIRVLVNSNTEPVPGLVLLGVDDYWAGKPDFDATWKEAPADAGHVFLCHNPLALSSVRKRKCLMLAGHTHGGQVNLPFIPRSMLPGLRGWKYIEGWYNEGEVRMYVNRGIGMIRPAVRFLCRPEVTLFTLRSPKR